MSACGGAAGGAATVGAGVVFGAEVLEGGDGAFLGGDGGLYPRNVQMPSKIELALKFERKFLDQGLIEQSARISVELSPGTELSP